MAKNGQPTKDPMLSRKPNTGGIRNEMQEQHKRDINALEAAKQMEKDNAEGSVTVRLEHGTLTAKPETIRHILNLRGYKEKEIDLIMDTAR